MFSQSSSLFDLTFVSDVISYSFCSVSCDRNNQRKDQACLAVFPLGQVPDVPNEWASSVEQRAI